jgi:hypothetical protein
MEQARRLIGVMQDAFSEPDRNKALSEPELVRLWKEADLVDVLAVMGAFDDPTSLRREAAAIVEGFLASGVMPVKTEPAQKRLAELDRATRLAAQGMIKTAAYAKRELLETLRSRCKSFEEQEGVKAVISLVELSMTENRYSLIVTAASIGRSIQHAAGSKKPALAAKFAAELRSRRQTPALAEVQSLTRFGLDSEPTDPFKKLVLSLHQGPAILAEELKSGAWTKERIYAAWEAEGRLSLVLALAALDLERAPLLAAIRSIIGPEPHIVKAFGVIERVPENFAFGRVHAAYRIGEFLGADPGKAEEFRTRVKPEIFDLEECLNLFSQASQADMVRRLKSVLFR